MPARSAGGLHRSVVLLSRGWSRFTPGRARRPPAAAAREAVGPGRAERKPLVVGPVDGETLQRARTALDELGHLLLAGESTQSVLQRVVDLVRQAMPEGVEASITLMRNEQATTAAFTGEL